MCPSIWVGKSWHTHVLGTGQFPLKNTERLSTWNCNLRSKKV